MWKSRVEKGELPLSIYSFSDFARETSFGKNQSGFEIKKYADKLKDFVCMLIGCTREQLEDHEFKNTELPAEWDKFAFYRENTRRPLRIYTSKEEAEKDVKIFKGGKVEILKMTPRLLLQLLGTECIRDKVHPNAWVNALFADYKAKWVPTGDSVAEEDVSLEKEYPNWIITDMRFPNELEAVKSRGGISIRVNRTYTTVVGGNGIPATFNQNQFHPSETSLDSATFDFVISNDKDIEHLINEVRKILEKLNII